MNISPKPVKYKRGQHPNSKNNLQPFKPGENGNKEGYSLTSTLKHALTEPLKRPDVDAPAREHLVFETIRGAMAREPSPLNIVWDRVDGKLQDREPIRDINVVFVIGKGYREVVDGDYIEGTGVTKKQKAGE